VSLFEKLFKQPLTIHHGMLNSYTFEHSGKKYTHNFSTLKTAILRRLQEACVEFEGHRVNARMCAKIVHNTLYENTPQARAFARRRFD